MTFKKRFALLLAILFWGLVIVSAAHGLEVPERPLKYIVDLAGIVDDATENRLNGYLAQLERQTTAQLVVLTVDSLAGQSIEDFSINIAHNKWKLGQKGKDNGVLFVVAVKDRKYRIEVGYGLEGVLPDSLVGSLGRNILVPFFRKGDYAGGIFSATVAMANEIAADSGAFINEMPVIRQPSRPTKANKPGLFNTIVTLGVLLFMVILFVRNPRLFLLLFLFSSMGGRRGSWGGGGGFGGGGFGSFGGGGGGGFGGGGASGGW